MDVQLQVTVDTTSNSELEQLNILKKKQNRTTTTTTTTKKTEQREYFSGIFYQAFHKNLNR